VRLNLFPFLFSSLGRKRCRLESAQIFSLWCFFSVRMTYVPIYRLVSLEIYGESSKLTDLPGDFIAGATPDPIPNSAVKPRRADDTANGGKVGRRQDFFPFMGEGKKGSGDVLLWWL
jgi:hypothetical protein